MYNMGIHDCVGDQGHMYAFARIPRKGTPTQYPPAFIPISKKTEVEQGNFPFKCQVLGFKCFL